MKKFLLLLIVPLLSSNTVFAQLQLKLSQDVKNSDLSYFLENSYTPPSDLPSLNPSDEMRKMFMVGIAADLTFPFGDEFKHVAGTGFSGHAMLGYAFTRTLMAAARVGYIKYADQTQEDEFGNYEDSFSQILISLGIYHKFATSGRLSPFVGIALGMFLNQYSFTWSYDPGFGSPITIEGDESDSKFGVIPSVGLVYALSTAAMLSASVEYNYIFGKLVEVEGEEDRSDNLSSLSFLVGVLFALGGG